MAASPRNWCVIHDGVKYGIAFDEYADGTARPLRTLDDLRRELEKLAVMEIHES